MKGREEILRLVGKAMAAGASMRAACDALGVSKRTVQRWAKNPREDGRRKNRLPKTNALSAQERRQIVQISCSREFRDTSPNVIVAILAERGQYVASERTFYRVLRSEGLMTRRGRAKAPERKRPDELTADAPNQVWSWDISALPSFVHGLFFRLYLMLDIWDRSIVGWAVHDVEDGVLAGDMLRETCTRLGIEPKSIVLHMDNGAAMTSAEFLSALHAWGRPSYSRPGVSDDNPFSESIFKTAKYCPAYPGRFATIEEVRAWVAAFVEWYNYHHRHSGIGFVTPMERRTGKDIAVLDARRATYRAAQARHPERWARHTRKWDSERTVTLNGRSKKKNRQNEGA